MARIQQQNTFERVKQGTARQPHFIDTLHSHMTEANYPGYDCVREANLNEDTQKKIDGYIVYEDAPEEGCQFKTRMGDPDYGDDIEMEALRLETTPDNKQIIVSGRDYVGQSDYTMTWHYDGDFSFVRTDELKTIVDAGLDKLKDKIEKVWEVYMGQSWTSIRSNGLEYEPGDGTVYYFNFIRRQRKDSEKLKAKLLVYFPRPYLGSQGADIVGYKYREDVKTNK